MTASIVSAADIIAFVGFVAAIGLLAITPSQRPTRGFFTPAVRWAFIASWAVYAYTTFADIGGDVLHLGIADYYENYIEMLFPVLLLMGVFAAYSAQQIGDLARSQRALDGAQSLMMGVVDAAPSGIMLLDINGAIAFANETSKRALELTEDDDGYFEAPWLPKYSEPTSLAQIVSSESIESVPVVFDWPGGRRLTLIMTTRPLLGGDGRFRGVVATFDRPS